MRITKESYLGLGKVPIGIGAVLKGWDMKEEEYRDSHMLPVVDFRAMTNSCMHDCFHCFTDKNKRTLSIASIKNVIDQLADSKAHAIDFLGEGEPTLDNHFMEIVSHAASRGIQPVIFTDAATRLRDQGLIRKINDIGATACPKCDSLFDEDYQNWVVGDKSNNYFRQRNEAIDLLMRSGFNEIREDGTTRLGFDMVISKRNIGEVEKTLRWCRDNNIWAVFSFYLPSGRSGSDGFDRSLMVSEKEKDEMREVIRKIDGGYGFYHPIWNNFATTPCVEFMQIYGDGRVSPCPGNETIIGNVRTDSIAEIEQRMIKRFPGHERNRFDGHCLYRDSIQGKAD